MRIASLKGRSTIITDQGAVDLEAASRGELPADCDELFKVWDKVAATALDLSNGAAFNKEDLQAPSLHPRQVFAIGLNYKKHAEESGMGFPSMPATFTKFPTSLTGPFADVPVVGDSVDWEVEIVAVIGKEASHVKAAEAWSYVAGLTVGQDFSDRHVQFAAGSQFSLGKSFYGYGPTGPWLVTIDEFEDPNDLQLSCSLNGVEVQNERSTDMIFTIPELIEELSKITPLLPGDHIWTGTPSGCGIFMQPPRFLREGDVIESKVEGIGTIRNLVTKGA